ncbi:MAG: hypothetical protein AB1486_22570 [Planctomycetota bacterium]
MWKQAHRPAIAVLVLLALALLPCLASGQFAGPSYGGATYLEKLGEVGIFFGSMQIMNPADPNYGGILRDENSADGYQSDVGKAIWCWSTLKALTGTADFDSRIALAWIYQNRIDPNTRSVWYQYTYDSAWFLIGEMAYRHATGDASNVTLAETHATWVINNKLDWRIPRDIVTDGFASGAIYDWAVDQGNTQLQTDATNRGDDVRQEIENNPTLLQTRSIEIAGAIGYMGVLKSVFQSDYEARKGWIETYAPYLPTSIPSGGYQYSYQGYVAGAHEVTWEYTANPAWKAIQMSLVPPLIAEDDDNDGGIPRNSTLTYDDSWVTGNLGHFNFYEMIPDLDLTISPDNWRVVVPGSFVFDFGAAHHRNTTQSYYLVAFLKFPSGYLVVLAVVKVTLPAGYVLSVPDVAFPFGAGSPTGTYELKIQSYTTGAKLLDTAVAQFEVL